jgi:hypothetical protein
MRVRSINMQKLLNNRYRILRTLGGGGFGETFLAEDTQIKYIMKTGQVVPTSVGFLLLWDVDNSRWVVADAI